MSNSPVPSHTVGSSRIHSSLEKTSAVSSYKSIMRSYMMLKPKDSSYPMNKLDPTIMTAFDTIEYNPEEDPPEFIEKDLEDLTMKFPEVEELIVDPKFYSMTTFMIPSFRRMLEFRNSINT